MTVSSTIRKAGPFVGGNSFPFSFKVFSRQDIKVIIADAFGAERTLLLDSEYSVSLNVDQDNMPGGTVTLSGVSFPGGGKLVIIGNIELTQGTDITNQGGFLPQVVEDALDRATIQIQQLAEEQSRALTVPATDTRTGAQVLTDIFLVERNAMLSAAAAAESLLTFRGIYYGPLSGDPTLDPNGNAPTIGDFYFNTATNTPRVLTSAGWANAVTAAPVSFMQQLFSGTGAQTVFTLATPPASTTSLLVFVGGLAQRLGTDFNISGSTLTFTVAPATGTNNITVINFTPVNVGVPNDGSVTTPKLADGAVTPGKLSAGAPTWNATGSVTLGNSADDAHTSIGRHTFNHGFTSVGRSLADAMDIRVQMLGAGSGTRTLDQSVANFFSNTVNGATTFVFASPPAANFAGAFVLELINGGSAPVTWPTSVRWPSGIAPTLTANGVDLIAFVTDDQGANWRGNAVVRDSR